MITFESFVFCIRHLCFGRSKSFGLWKIEDMSLASELAALANTLQPVRTWKSAASRKALKRRELNTVIDRYFLKTSSLNNEPVNGPSSIDKHQYARDELAVDESSEPSQLSGLPAVEFSETKESNSDGAADEAEFHVSEYDGVTTIRHYKSQSSQFQNLTEQIWQLEELGDTTHSMPRLEAGAGITETAHLDAQHLANSNSSCRQAFPCDPNAHLNRQFDLGQMHLSVYFPIGKTGFEEDKDFTIVPGEVIAGRYKIVSLLGEAAFSRAMRCLDLTLPLAAADDAHSEGYEAVCVKVINSGKEFFDQALDEIKILQLLSQHSDPEETHVVSLYDFFYFREHIFIVCELLSDNLYEFSKYNRETLGEEFYFTLPRLRSVVQQVLEALVFIHSLGLVHCDLKPENIMFRSHSRCEIKVIDFGSSCFKTDRLSGYIQSRSYRAPEVILGCDYDGRIDIWSLGAIIVELVTGDVLFHSETVPEMLARIVSVLGESIPSESVLAHGRHTCAFVDRFGAFYELAPTEDGEDECMTFHYPILSDALSLESRIEQGREPVGDSKAEVASLCDFVRRCLTLDFRVRPTASDLLSHPFLAQ